MPMSSEVNSTANEDCVTIDINEMLTKLESQVSSDSCIFKVPDELRSVNEKAYEPQMIAIGPYHHGKAHLIAMEEHKIRYLQSFLRRGDKNDVSSYVQLLRRWEESARKCYAEPLHLSEDKFVAMMLLDGCFIIEFLCKLTEGEADPLFRLNHKLTRLKLDLLLLENQLPFFILWELLVMSNVISKPGINFIKMILGAYKWYRPGPAYVPRLLYTSEEVKQFKNLLGLIHDHWQPSSKRMLAYSERKRNERKNERKRSTRCARELKEAGIGFKSVKECNMFDVEFENGRIKIPEIRIVDKTECVLRNLIAYEQLTYSRSPKYFTDYMIFMDSLIDSAKDVEILCRQGIIENRMGDDETIAFLFNKMGQHVFCNRVLYADIEDKVDKHCKRKWNLQMAKLRRDYFNSPWAFISFLGAIILLLLTGIQTVYSVLSYYK
ncbi:hypothetical protein P3X46_006399 [Hevea brasiliensis]|uniref:Uncharacterized protein n=1 Tax=Hevea brasiliensis TaxID=3981 RepID=A0ABQ9MSM4_HEVBR|nr:putative UPF0481 protein At3g02645 [Hevea brasiliensis]KAJ9182398.1 hypothetical protein P3X46_006399 [Hevea brasiliensis]